MEAGPKGWIELSPQVEFVKFTMIPDGYKNVLVKNDMALIDQFYGLIRPTRSLTSIECERERFVRESIAVDKVW